MKLATYKWNIKITYKGKSSIPYYYGFKTKREAQERADKWNQLKDHTAEVIKS